MRPPLIFMFSGQGSQYFQMGKELYHGHPVFRRTLDHGDSLAKEILGQSVVAEIYGHTRNEVFDALRFTHPALLLVQYAVYETLLSEGIIPDQVWGSSLGEMIAAVAAGVWSLESALLAITEQARLVTAKCAPGGMLAILADASRYGELKRMGYDIVLAGINFKNHFSIAGDDVTLTRVEAHLKGREITSLRLPVRYAFHSAALDSVEREFISYCAMLPMRPTTRIPFLSGVYGKYLNEITPEYFWGVIRGPMCFSETIAALEARGTSIFVDCGPSGTLATFAKYGIAESSASSCFPILTQFHGGIQKLAQLKDYLARQA